VRETWRLALSTNRHPEWIVLKGDRADRVEGILEADAVGIKEAEETTALAALDLVIRIRRIFREIIHLSTIMSGIVWLQASDPFMVMHPNLYKRSTSMMVPMTIGAIDKL
jgi:hypothetical protein